MAFRPSVTSVHESNLDKALVRSSGESMVAKNRRVCTVCSRGKKFWNLACLLLLVAVVVADGKINLPSIKKLVTEENGLQLPVPTVGSKPCGCLSIELYRWETYYATIFSVAWNIVGASFSSQEIDFRLLSVNDAASIKMTMSTN